MHGTRPASRLLSGLRAAACAALLSFAAAPATSQSTAADAAAQNYPTRPVRIVVPTGAGGITDILARHVGQMLSERLGQPVIVENRPGAGGTIGTLAVAKAPPDGYTLLWVFPSHPVSPSLFPNLPYDPVKDLTPIVRVTNVELVLLVNPQVRANTVKELIALERANPGSMNYGAVGSGSLGHLAAVVFNSMTGSKFVHVSYRGTPEVQQAMLANDVQVFFDVPITAGPQIKAGKMRALAVTGTRRIATLPDVPTMAEAGVPGYDVTSWNGILAPAGTPAAIVRRLNDEVVRILQRPDVKQWLAERAIEAVGSTPEAFGAVIEADIAKWRKVIVDTGIKAN